MLGNPFPHLPNQQLIGFDLDDTLTENWWTNINQDQYLRHLTNSKTNWESLMYIRTLLLELKCTMIPIIPCYIITNRPVWLLSPTYYWMKFHLFPFFNIICADAINSSIKEISNYKAKVINILHLKEYYEDNPEIIHKLTSLCPSTKILLPEEAVRLGRAYRTEEFCC